MKELIETLPDIVERIEDNLEYQREKEKNERTCKYCSEPTWAWRDKCQEHWEEIGGTR